MKKALALLLCLLMVLPLLVACGGTEESKTESKSTGETSTGSTDESVEVSKEPVVITIGMPQNANVKDFDTNGYTLWLEEQTGYDIQFQYFASAAADYKSQVATAFSNEKTAKEMPDMLVGMALGRYVYEEYGESGFLLNLESYYADQDGIAKPFWDFMNKMNEYDPTTYKMFLRRMYDANDNQGWYCIPRLEQSTADVGNGKVFINQAWLTKLGLSMPTSLDELHTVLVAFKNGGDLNGNGAQDEIPMVGRVANYGSLYEYLYNNFIYASTENFFNVDSNNKLSLPFVTDEYRKGLELIYDWTQEGLIQKNVASISQTDLKSLINPTDGKSRVGVWFGHPSIVLVPDNQALFDYEAMPAFSTQYCVENEQANTFNSFICAHTKYPEECFKLAMLCFTEASATRQRYGVYGVDWVEADPGAVSFTGEPAKVKLINDIWGTVQNQEWGAVRMTGLWAAENEENQIPSNASDWMKHKFRIFGDHLKAWLAQKEKTNSAAIKCPALAYSDDVKEEWDSKISNLKTTITQHRNKFATGEMNPHNDAEWNAYLASMNELGLEGWLKVAQACYEDMYAKAQ